MINKLIIIGSGPAGYTAAIYAARACLEPVLFEGIMPGGPLATTTSIENFPGFPDGVDGPELISLMRRQAEKMGTKLVSEQIVAVDFSTRPFKIFAGDNKEEYQAETIIIATGSNPRKLGIEAEKRLANRGVSYCATCDGPLYKNKKVAVIGGGDSAMEEALFLSKFASGVVIVNRSEKFRASDVMINRAKDNPKIEWLLNTEVKDLAGEKKLEKLKLYNKAAHEESEIEADGVFVAIGRTPNTQIFEEKLEMKDGFIKTVNGSTAASVNGVFAAGDCADPKYRQAVVAAGQGAMAAIEVEKYLGEMGI